MKLLKSALYASLVLALAACGGGGHLSVDPSGVDENETLTLNFPPGEPREYRLPFRISGGIPPYESRLLRDEGEDPNCPDWVTLFPDQRILAGTAPAAASGTFFCVYRITESDPGFRPQRSVTHGLRIEVAGPVTGTLMLLPASKVSLSVGTFHSQRFPAASGGTRPYTYSFDCAGGRLPSGMGFARETRIFAGTPDARFRDSCTYSVTDRSQPAAMVSVPVEVEVAGPITGTLMLPRPGKVDLSVGRFHDIALPAATGGVEPYTYAFECAGGSPPPGMNFAPATRMFAGTPNVRFHDSCTYSVTDSSTIMATVSRAVEVEATSAETEPLALPENAVRGDGGERLDRVSLIMGQRARIPFVEASGGVQPYIYELQCDLPRGVSFSPDTRILSGSPEEVYRGPDCTYSVTDSASPPESVSRSVPLIVDPLDLGEWRFRTRTVQPGGPCALRAPVTTPVAILPLARRGIGAETGEDRYVLTDVPGGGSNDFLTFDPGTRRLAYTHRSADPVLGTPTTYRYLVGTDASVDATNAHDALCVDVQYNTGRSAMCGDPSADPPDDPDNYVHISLRIRDDAYHDGSEWRCPDTTAPAPRSNAQGVSNPVHEALGPVHARRALDVAHGAVRDRVRGWTPGAARVLTAIAPQIGIGSLSGESGGFDYTGSSESVSTGAEIGSGSWQAGLVGSHTRTELHYRAAAGLAERGYRSGEHSTEILSLHPFAAWHMPSGGSFWTSLGAGTGRLSHRDDLGFPSWSRSDVHLRSYAAGASVPVADILAGDLEAEAGLEAFAFEIEGGGRISSALPTLRGRDWRAGLTWSAPVRGAPSLSVAYRHLTGDGPEGGQLEAKGSVSVDGILDPRLSLISTVEGAFGLGDREHKSWGLSGGVRFAPGEDRRGLGLNLDTRLVSPDGGGSADVGLRGEAGYGMRGVPLFPTLRPFAGFTRYSGDGSLRRSIGIDLRDTPGSRVRVEAWDRPRDRLRAIRASLRHRF